MTVAADKIPEHSYSPGAAMAPEAIPFEFIDAAHLRVVVSGSEAEVSASDYSIGGDGMALTGTITALVAVDPAVVWTVFSETPDVQQLDLVASRIVPMTQYERELDRRALVSREQKTLLDRAPLVPRGEAAPEFASLADLADGDLLEFRDGKLSRFNVAPFAGKFYAGDATGRLVPALGTGADAALRGDLSDPLVGPNLIGWGDGTLAEKLQERVSVRDFLPFAGGSIPTAVNLGIAFLNTIGGGILDFAGIVATTTVITLNGVSNITLKGSGAKLSRPGGSGSNSALFIIKGGCSDIEISGFGDLDGGYDGSANPSTGSSPVILIGDNLAAGDGGATNQRIRILNNRIRRSNWGAVMIYGKSGPGGAPTPTNRDILVDGNMFDKCCNGVFAYKNNRNIHITNNIITNSGFDGIVLDSMAASDAVTSEGNFSCHISNNTIDTFGTYGQGIGILAKGINPGTRISNNVIKNGMVQAAPNMLNYGILVNQDAALTPCRDVLISGNYIENILGSLSGNGIVISGTNSDRIIVANNTVKGVTGAGIQSSSGTVGLIVIGNTVMDVNNAYYMYRFEGINGTPISNLLVACNLAIKGTGISIGGFIFNWTVNSTEFGNVSVGNTTAVAAINSVRLTRNGSLYDTAVPTTGTYTVGERVRNATPTTLNVVTEWACVVGGTPGTWRQIGHIVSRGTTAGRPVLTASDVGVKYLDNTLDADGKAIEWNGTAWVDATGAVV